MLQTELIFFVQRDNHIILFLYINIERGVLVVFSTLAAFFWYFCRTYFRFLPRGLTSGSKFWLQKIEYVAVFSYLFFFGSVFCYLPFEKIHFRFHLRYLTSGS